MPPLKLIFPESVLYSVQNLGLSAWGSRIRNLITVAMALYYLHITVNYAWISSRDIVGLWTAEQRLLQSGIYP
jgi:hypothetical protein